MSDPKISGTKSVGFRPGADLRTWLDALARDTKWPISEILRVGVIAYKPEFEALARSTGGRKLIETPEELRTYIDSCRAAKKLGIDPSKALADMVEAKLAEDSLQPAGA